MREKLSDEIYGVKKICINERQRQTNELTERKANRKGEREVERKNRRK